MHISQPSGVDSNISIQIENTESASEIQFLLIKPCTLFKLL